jgi:hypothetical protein
MTSPSAAAREAPTTLDTIRPRDGTLSLPRIPFDTEATT